MRTARRSPHLEGVGSSLVLGAHACRKCRQRAGARLLARWRSSSRRRRRRSLLPSVSGEVQEASTGSAEVGSAKPHLLTDTRLHQLLLELRHTIEEAVDGWNQVAFGINSLMPGMLRTRSSLQFERRCRRSSLNSLQPKCDLCLPCTFPRHDADKRCSPSCWWRISQANRPLTGSDGVLSTEAAGRFVRWCT